MSKYFHGELEDMNVVMDTVSRWTVLVNSSLLNEEYARNPAPTPIEQLFQWKHLYHALGKLTEGLSLKVTSSLAVEAGFEAWRQFNLRFERELEA